MNYFLLPATLGIFAITTYVSPISPFVIGHGLTIVYWCIRLFIIPFWNSSGGSASKHIINNFLAGFPPEAVPLTLASIPIVFGVNSILFQNAFPHQDLASPMSVWIGLFVATIPSALPIRYSILEWSIWFQAIIVSVFPISETNIYNELGKDWWIYGGGWQGGVTRLVCIVFTYWAGMNFSSTYRDSIAGATQRCTALAINSLYQHPLVAFLFPLFLFVASREQPDEGLPVTAPQKQETAPMKKHEMVKHDTPIDPCIALWEQ